jgi:hypothetical protein
MAHVATLWQITLATDPTFAAPVLTKFTTTQLTTLPFSGIVLLPLTNYLARAAYYSDTATVSPFGASVPFTTLADGTIPVPVVTEWAECE